MRRRSGGEGLVRFVGLCKKTIEREKEGRRYTFVVDDFLRELDRGVVPVRGGRHDTFSCLGPDRFTFPIRAASGGVELPAPDDADTACRCSESSHLAIRYGVVQFLEELCRKAVLFCIEGFLPHYGLFVFFCGAFDGALAR